VTGKRSLFAIGERSACRLGVQFIPDR
jgi:hypothetical protein